jgi:putative tryptophan/tyrosine transport system substrate-binding protein
MRFLSSCAGITRASILREKMDCRVKPGNDEADLPHRHKRLRRRAFLTLLGGAAAASIVLPLAARAQAERIKRIGWLILLPQDHPESQARFAAFHAGLAAAGWTEGHNIHIESRWVADFGRLRAIAAELVKLKPDAIMVGGSPSLIAMLEESRTVPVVFVATAGNVEHGIVTNVARPSGNATGFTLFDDFTLVGKLLGTLKEIAPSIARSALLMRRGHPSLAGYRRSLEGDAPRLGITPAAFEAADAAEIERVIESWAREPNASLLLPPDQFLIQHRELIIASAARHRLPAVYGYRQFVSAGGLVSYGVDVHDLYRRAAGYVDRILKGEKPADLPVQAPVKYELAVNLKTARALGLTVPNSIQLLADEVVE